MTNEEYVRTLQINDIEVKVGIDDDGQCYFFEYLDPTGKIKSASCGTYNSEYIPEILSALDVEYRYMSLRKMFSELFNDDYDALMKERHRDQRIKEEYQSVGIDYEEYLVQLEQKKNEYAKQGIDYVNYWLQCREKEIENQK